MTGLDALTETLTAACIDWDHAPASTTTARRYQDALNDLVAAAGHRITHMQLSAAIAAHRRGRPAIGDTVAARPGMDIGSAVQTAIHDLAPDHAATTGHHDKEAG